jgi:hypothetical protein
VNAASLVGAAYVSDVVVVAMGIAVDALSWHASLSSGVVRKEKATGEPGVAVLLASSTPEFRSARAASLTLGLQDRRSAMTKV